MIAEQYKLEQLEKLIGYTFLNQSLLVQALTHKSKSKDNNERLEFLGDALLETIISTTLFHQKPTASEGELTRFRATLVRGKTLAELAVKIRLKDFVIVGSGELRTGGYQRDSILADTFESIIAAIYLDSKDFTLTTSIVLNLYSDLIQSLPDVEALKDSKTLLQEKLQGMGIAKPIYKTLNITGPDHSKLFEIECSAGDYRVSATGQSKKKAEQNAARIILEKYINESI